MSQPNEPGGPRPDDESREERGEPREGDDADAPAVDPDAPARTLIEPDAPGVEPNEPA
jgi:hypothetical protein